MIRRRAVIAIGIAAAAAAAEPADVLVLKTGERRPGEVSGCREDACTLDGATVARGLIAWVGLQQAPDAPTPSPRDPLRDEVHLRNGGHASGDFVGLSLGAVALGDVSYDREDVAWIRFRGAVQATGAPPPPARAPSPSPSPSPGRSGGPCPRGSPLGGSIVQDVRSRGPEMNCSGRAELWFELAPPAGSSWPFSLHGAHQASVLSYRLRIDGCQAVMNPHGIRCSVPEKEAFDTLRGSGSSLELSFTPLLPELSFEILPEAVALVSQGECRDREGSVLGPAGWSVRPGGTIRPPAEGDPARYDVAPAPCNDPPPSRQRDCDFRPDRYAVIPFQGVGTLRDDVSLAGWSTDTTTRWNVCCGCGARAAASAAPNPD